MSMNVLSIVSFLALVWLLVKVAYAGRLPRTRNLRRARPRLRRQKFRPQLLRQIRRRKGSRSAVPGRDARPAGTEQAERA